MVYVFTTALILTLASFAVSWQSISIQHSFPMLLRRFAVFPRTTVPLRAFSSQNDLIARLRDKSNKFNNIPDGIVDKVGRNLHLKQHHPLNIIKRRLELLAAHCSPLLYNALCIVS